MSGVGRFIRKRRAKRAAFMADPAIIKRESISPPLRRVRDLAFLRKVVGQTARIETPPCDSGGYPAFWSS